MGQVRRQIAIQHAGNVHAHRRLAAQQQAGGDGTADAFSDAGIDLVGGASAHQQQAAMRKAGGGQQLDNFTHPALKSRGLDRRLHRPLRGGIGRLGPGAERAIRAGKHHERSDRFGHIGQIGNGEHENPFRFEQAF